MSNNLTNIMYNLVKSAKHDNIVILNNYKDYINKLPPPFIRYLLNIALKDNNYNYVDSFFSKHPNIKNQMFKNKEYIIKISNEEGYKSLKKYFEDLR